MAAQKLLIAPPALLEDPRWELIQRIAASRHFTKATHLHDFLLFISIRALEGREDEINELNIGSAVLGRDAHFSPAEDNIVRVQARHLRKKLEDYFADEGRSERLIVTIPKGGYVPRFDPRPYALHHPAAEHSRNRALPHLNWFLLGTATSLLICLALWFLLTARATSQKNPLLARLFQSGQETNIVVADSCLAVIQDILNTDITLAEYMEPGFRQNMLARAPEPTLRQAVDKLFSRQYTSLGDLNIASRLAHDARLYPGSSRIRYARHISLREFKTSNFILIGSRRSIPWDGLFEDKLNFFPVWEAATGRFYFRNRKPLPNELPAYSTSPTGAKETFATITLLPNLDHTGWVLLLTGLTMEGSEAVGEFAISPEASSRLEAPLSAMQESGRGFLEALVKVSVVGGAASDPEILAIRTQPVQ